MPDVGIPRRLAAAMTIGEQQEWLRRYLGRHRVSRRTALKGGASVLAALGATTAPWALTACARAASTPVAVIGRHLSFGSDPRRQMAIAAELTGKPMGRVLVDVGADATYGQTLEAEVRNLVSMVPQQDGSIRGADQFFVHGLVDGLAPGARLHYRFRLADGTTTPDAVFTTAPAADRVGAVHVHRVRRPGREPTRPDRQTGFSDNYYKPDDTRRAAAPSDALVALVAAQRPAFHLLAGDICYADPSGNGHPVKNNGAGTADNGFDNFDPTVWSQYFGVIEKSAAATPWLFATGNHDMEALYDDNRAPGGAAHGYAGHAARLDLPRTGPAGCPSVYSVVYGNVGVLSLDANDLSAEIPTNAGYSQRRPADLARPGAWPSCGPTPTSTSSWRSSTTAPTRPAPPTPPTAACAPRSPRCSTGSPSTSSCRATTTSTSAPTRSAAASPPARPPTAPASRPRSDGTTYICCGSGGRPRYGWQPGETDSYRGAPTPARPVDQLRGRAGRGEDPETVDWSRTRYLDYAFLSVHVTPAAPGGTATMSVRAVTDGGREIDRVDLVRGPRPVTPAWRLSVPGHVG